MVFKATWKSHTPRQQNKTCGGGHEDVSVRQRASEQIREHALASTDKAEGLLGSHIHEL